MVYKSTVPRQYSNQPMVKQLPTSTNSSQIMLETIREEASRPNSVASFDSLSVYSIDADVSRGTSSTGLDTTPEPSIDGDAVREDCISEEDKCISVRPLSVLAKAAPLCLAAGDIVQTTTQPPKRNPLRLQVSTPSMVSREKENAPPQEADVPVKSPSPSIDFTQLQSFLDLGSPRDTSSTQRKGPSNARPPIFVYGYLADHLLLSLLLFGRLRNQKEPKVAKVSGYDIRVIERSKFPVLVSAANPFSSNIVEGLLLEDLSPHERKKIKNFQPRSENPDTGARTSLLRKTNVKVKLDDGEEIDAVSFVWDDRSDTVHNVSLSRVSWDSKAAKKRSLKAYAAVFWSRPGEKAGLGDLKRRQSLPSMQVV